jgi:5-carboxyvanillate decarboxylase
MAEEALRLVATEEAFACEEYAREVQKLIDAKVDDFDLYKMWFSGEPPKEPGEPWETWWKRVTGFVPEFDGGKGDGWLGWWRGTRGRLFDLGDVRLGVMDAAEIDVFILSLISPGVQLFDADTANAMARVTNDAMAEAIAKHPTRFAGLASFAPQDPKEAAKEIERAIETLGLNGLIVNSHTNGEYFDDPKFWPIFEAACAVDAPIYIHPRNPPTSDAMRRMLTIHGGHRASEVVWGYQMETGLHAVRMILGGVFKQFPKLQIVLGHLGENVPAWLFRLNWAAQYAGIKPSELFKTNFYVTTSGVSRDPIGFEMLAYCNRVLGPDRIMFAVDYPFGDANDAAWFMRNAPISREDKEKMAFMNAEKVFRIRASSSGASEK